MENKENLSIQSSRNPSIPQAEFRKNVVGNCLLQNRFIDEYSKNENAATPKMIGTKGDFKADHIPSKAEGSNQEKKKENALEGTRRAALITGGRRKTTESGAKDRSPSIPTSKSFSAQPKSNSFDRRSIGSTRSTSPSAYSKAKKQCLSKNRGKSPTKNNRRIACAEDVDSTSLLAQAISEQGQVIEMLSAAMEELRGKMVEKIRSKETAKDFTEGVSSEAQKSTNFENSYSGTLEEIFQAWVNLFYFIINLRINLIRILNCAGTEPFTPNQEIEKEIVGQAIECVKFFSKLKIKSLVNSLEGFHLSDEVRIKDYEEKVSAPFLFEMDFIQKKAKEILEHAKSEKKIQPPKRCDRATPLECVLREDGENKKNLL